MTAGDSADETDNTEHAGPAARSGTGPIAVLREDLPRTASLIQAGEFSTSGVGPAGSLYRSLSEPSEQDVVDLWSDFIDLCAELWENGSQVEATEMITVAASRFAPPDVFVERVTRLASDADYQLSVIKAEKRFADGDLDGAQRELASGQRSDERRETYKKSLALREARRRTTRGIAIASSGVIVATLLGLSVYGGYTLKDSIENRVAITLPEPPANPLNEISGPVSPDTGAPPETEAAGGPIPSQTAQGSEPPEGEGVIEATPDPGTAEIAPYPETDVLPSVLTLGPPASEASRDRNAGTGPGEVSRSADSDTESAGSTDTAPVIRSRPSRETTQTDTTADVGAPTPEERIYNCALGRAVSERLVTAVATQGVDIDREAVDAFTRQVDAACQTLDLTRNEIDRIKAAIPDDTITRIASNILR